MVGVSAKTSAACCGQALMASYEYPDAQTAYGQYPSLLTSTPPGPLLTCDVGAVRVKRQMIRSIEIRKDTDLVNSAWKHREDGGTVAASRVPASDVCVPRLCRRCSGSPLCIKQDTGKWQSYTKRM